jgi:hypothetical protein
MPSQLMLVTRKAMRPASDREECFYCLQPIGAAHKPDCVLIEKKVLVRMTVEYEISVPSCWSKEDIEFHRNEGTWCAGNIIEELQELAGESECLCNCTRFTYLGGDSKPFLAE